MRIAKWRKAAATVLASVLVGAGLTLSNASVAEARILKPSFCNFTIRNDLLHPTWSVRCYGTKRAYRAVATCQFYRARGEWAWYGGKSTARCFFMLVDRPSSGVEFR